MFDRGDRVIHYGTRKGRVHDSMSDESYVEFDDGKWCWVYNSDLEYA